MKSFVSKWWKFYRKLPLKSHVVFFVLCNFSCHKATEGSQLSALASASLCSWQHQGTEMDSASSYLSDRLRELQDRGTVLLDVFHRLLEKLPCVLLLEIFALGKWLLRQGHSISLRVQYDDKQMVCSDLCLGFWFEETIALMIGALYKGVRNRQWWFLDVAF